MLENMLDYVRIALYTLLIIIGFFLFQAWEKDRPKELPIAAQTETGSRIPEVAAPSQSATSSVSAPALAPTLAPSQEGKLVKITTDLFEVEVDTRGGDIVSTKLL